MLLTSVSYTTREIYADVKRVEVEQNGIVARTRIAVTLRLDSRTFCMGWSDVIGQGIAAVVDGSIIEIVTAVCFSVRFCCSG